MTRHSHELVTAAMLSLSLLAACGGDGGERSSEGSSATDRGAGMSVSSDANDSTALDGADVRITSTDGSITLAVLRDTVVMQLSDSLRASVKQQVDSSVKSEAGDGLGGAIAGMVGSAVSAAVNKAVGFALRAPASKVTELSYENGRLRFKVDGGGVKFGAKSDGDSDGAPFAEADAKRFIEAVEAAKARQTAM